MTSRGSADASSSRPTFAILISGRGSNMEAILRQDVGGECVGVLSSRDSAAGLATAAGHGLPTHVLSHKDHPDRADYHRALDAQLREWGAEWIVLAGFMRVLSDDFVRLWPERIVNIHPSLLPDFPGLDAQRQALEAGATVSGCTVHYVAPGAVDTGPIIAQAQVDVLPGDDEDSLSARILDQEHRLYPEVLRKLFSGAATAP